MHIIVDTDKDEEENMVDAQLLVSFNSDGKSKISFQQVTFYLIIIMLSQVAKYSL